MKRRAEVYKHKQRVLVITVSLAADKFGFHDGQCTALAVASRNDELGAVVRQHLLATRWGVSRDIRDRNDSVYSAAGCTSWAAFSRNAQMVMLAAGEDIRVDRCERERGGNYVPSHDATIVLPLEVADEVLGEHVMKAFSFAS